jgi:hypothetical protein
MNISVIANLLDAIIFKKLLDPMDYISLYRVQMMMDNTLLKKLTRVINNEDAAKLLFITLNMMTIYYQNVKASYFMCYTTSVSGITKLMRVLLSNPILGVFFYLSFYFRMIGETDIDKINMIAEYYNLPKYEALENPREFINKITYKIIGGKPEKEYAKFLVTTIQKVVNEQIIAKNIENIPDTIISFFNKNQKLVDSIDEEAVMISTRSIEKQLSYDIFIDELQNIKCDIKAKIPRKKKTKIKHKINLEVRKKVQELEPEAAKKYQKICLDDCKSRIKTDSGCYCSGNCGRNYPVGRNWCYVDQKKCKIGKKLQKDLFGNTYDYCNNKKKSVNCYTGINYEKCKLDESNEWKALKKRFSNYK